MYLWYVFLELIFFYKRFQRKKQEPNFLQVKNSSINIISSGFFNATLGVKTFDYFNINNDEVKINKLLFGIFLIDTIEYWYHYIIHNSKFLYTMNHLTHHQSYPVHPSVSFYNSNMEVLTLSPIIFCSFVYFDFSFLEYIIVTSLAYISTSCDHTYTSPNKFHILHHNGNKNKNFQQPFLTYWDHIMGTYNPKSEFKIPFYP